VKKRTGRKINYVEENVGNEEYLQHIENRKRAYSTLIANHNHRNTHVGKQERPVGKIQDRNYISTTKTLALADPVLRDGYRNQVFRLTAFVKYALQHGFEEILLPSIRWQH
jgi:hypothetical protein